MKQARLWPTLVVFGLLCAATLVRCASSPNPTLAAQGQLVCSIQTSGGGTLLAGLVAASASVAAPGAGPLVIIATNAGKAAVDADCAKAAASVAGGVSGVAVSPPAGTTPVAQLAIVTPASPVVAK